jgi:hypothetical protein
VWKPHFSDKKTPFASYHPELDETELLPPPDRSSVPHWQRVADNAGTFRYTIRNIYNVTVFNGPPPYGRITTCIWVSTKYTGGSIPLTLRTIRKELYIYRTTMVEFYPDASEISQMTWAQRNGSPIDRLCRCHARNKVSPFSTGIIMLLNNTPLVWISKGRKPLKPPRMVQSSLQQSRNRSYHWDAIQVAPTRRTPRANRDAGDNMSVVLNTTIPSSSLKENIWHAHTTESVKPLPEST